MSNAQENVDKNAVAVVSSTGTEENLTERVKNEDVKRKKEKSHNWAKIFQPWKWKKKKKSEKFTKTATALERKISVRSSREELLKRGVLTDVNGPPTIPEQGEHSQIADKADGPNHTVHGEMSNKENVNMQVHNSQNTKALLPSQHISSNNNEHEVGEHSNSTENVHKTTPPKPLIRSSKLLSQEADTYENSADSAQQRPVAAKRTKTAVPSGNQANTPPKPPPKPTKHITSYGECDKDRASMTGPSQKNVEVMFSGNVDVIQQVHEIPVHSPNTHNTRTLCKQNSIGGYESDSSGSIPYQHESDDDEEVPVGGLAAKVARRDTLALKLANRPNRKELEQRNIISSPEKTEEDRITVKKNLTRHLSQRPTKSELVERNIIPNETEEERHKEREKVKRQLTRKLSMRPTVKELIERKVLQWHEYVEVYEVQNYDRRGDKPWTRLTPSDKAHIRKELNEFKANEMEVHEDSKRFTRFHKP